MPITPAEVMELQEWEKEALPRWEAYIDTAVRFQYGYGDNAWVSLSESGISCSPRVRARLVEIYEAAGWKVEQHHDQREGYALKFTAANA